jgi:hypothetical protein
MSPVHPPHSPGKEPLSGVSQADNETKVGLPRAVVELSPKRVPISCQRAAVKRLPDRCE